MVTRGLNSSPPNHQPEGLPILQRFSLRPPGEKIILVIPTKIESDVAFTVVSPFAEVMDLPASFLDPITGELQSRGLVHFSASKHQTIGQSLAENMDLTPSPWTLQFAWAQ